jgi:uncharacterized protein (TIGR03083 family)
VGRDNGQVKPKQPINVLDLFPEERRALLGLLASLSPQAWQAPTACTGWSVQDVAAHILADDLGSLARGRDGHVVSPFPSEPNWDDLVAFVNRQNEEWVRAMRRLSPRLLAELLAWSGERLAAYFATVDLMATGPTVSWAGPGPHPWWLHIAREYTERWLHQEQIREAVGQPGLRGRRLFGPVLDTFARALPHTYRGVPAPDGTHVQLVITGEAGGAWSLVRRDGAWGLYDDVSSPPATIVTLDQDTAWRLFTKGIASEAARGMVRCEGDTGLGLVLLDAVAIIA